MKYAPLDTVKIRSLITDIQNNIKELNPLADAKVEDFISDRNKYALAEHYFRRSLEGILTIGTHILSRLPVRTKDYQEVIVSLGDSDIVPKEFAEKNKKLAGYRNRMVHMYWEITKEELHQIINKHLQDLDKFCEYYQAVLNEPSKFGFEAE
jgi:uncharacterized protein YutE (UPF0331/DUF86 family)